ncbi:hypothetical protein BDV96DRAFT_591004 [Lophiotrema nucula]|uniref:Uncharacterized protein n=1 Tax=Lophiotrema nucula TaxID=690887 RepID=A0A6A5YJG8_9PLEO|nr:hypothetical protein BDV96DRAFT_591004 [Lophiotrema nucula]
MKRKFDDGDGRGDDVSNRPAMYADICRIDAKKRAIADRLSDIRREEASANKELMDTIISYSKGELRALADTMNSKLPREVRDLVYESYWKLNDWELDVARTFYSEEYKRELHNNWNHENYTARHLECKKQRERTGSDPCCQCFSWHQFAACLLPAFVGQQAASEAVEALAQNIKPDCQVLFDDLHFELSLDVFHVNVAIFSRNDWYMIFACAPLRRSSSNSSGENWPPPLSRKARLTVEENFRSLLNVEGVPAKVVNILFQSEVSLADLERYLELFRATYLELVRRGWKFQVEFEPMLGEKVNGNNQFLIDYERMSLNAWRKKYGLDAMLANEQLKNERIGFDPNAMVD